VDVTQFLASIPPALVYVVVALVIGVESLGVPVPGETTLVAGSLMAAHDQLDVSIWGITIGAIVGAVVGDSIGYYIGSTHGRRLLVHLSERFPKHISLDDLAYAEHLFERHGAVTVFTGRFIALLRIIAGPLAGSLRMPYPKFLVANVSGGIAWASLVSLTTYALGSIAHTWLARFAWLALALFVLIGVLGSRYLHARWRHHVEAFVAGRENA
jgi:membrane protein DedA with SNARE-associated domain